MLHLDQTSKISNAFIDNAEDLDIVIPMCNLLEYSDNYFKTSGSLWSYYRDQVNDSAHENANNFRINNNKTKTAESFEYKTKVIARTPADNNTLDKEFVVPLRYLSTFGRFLDLSLINCEIELELKWTKNCVISEISRTSRVFGNPPVWEMATTRTRAIFQINDVKCYVLIVTLSINDNIKF